MNYSSKKRINELINLLKKCDYEYYVLNKPSITDIEYDQLFKELQTLEELNPEYQRFDSPTQRVGGDVLKNFKKVKHEHPMLSLGNVFNETELKNFDMQISKIVAEPRSYVIEPKIDGLSVSLVYINGILRNAITRGDGEYGEEVINNVKTIRSIPLTIPEKRRIIIRGEIFFTKTAFEKINEENVEKTFVNPRNAAAGTIHNLNPKIVAERKLSAMMYQIIDPINFGLFSHEDILTKLEEWKFLTTKSFSHFCKDIDSAIKYISQATKIKEKWNFVVDGLVLKLNDLTKHEEIGSTSKFPKWAIAYKFPANIIETKLIDIQATVGRTGKVTYIGKLLPVKLDGALISKATLHNYDYINEKDIRINDIVEIYKAGEIIPKILRPIISKRPSQSFVFSPIEQCPECQCKLKKLDEEVDYFCMNNECPERILRNIIHYCSREAMNITGVSSLILTKLYKAKIINNIADLYTLQEKKAIVTGGNFLIKDKLWNKIINSINDSKKNSLERLIFGIGIRHVGFQVASIVAKQFKTIENIIKIDCSQIEKLFGIGQKIAQSITNFFKIGKNVQLVNNLQEKGVNTTYIEKQAKTDFSNIYYNKIFVITGKFELPRNQIKEILENKYGAQVKGQISSKTNYLLIGNNPTLKKIEIAKKLNIKIINEKIW